MTGMVNPDARFAIEVGVIVSDTDTALRFYRDTLGLRVAGRFAHPGLGIRATALAVGGSCIKLVEYDTLPGVRNPPGQAIGFRYLTLPVSDVAAAVAACDERGYEVVLPPTALASIADTIGGCEIAFVLDSDGNRVELCRGSPWMPA